MDIKKLDLRKVTFGMTSAIITGIAAVGTLFENPNGKMLVIPSLLIFAIADNIADTFGMHIYQDSELLKEKQVWMGTLFNYCARLTVSSLFIAILLVFPTNLASILCIVIGLFLLTIISYIIAQRRQINPVFMILEHVGLAIAVLALSTIAGNVIRSQIH
jgi:VIT1/CCC1 family predicted Fe2+/Mn2+ transporter